MRMFMLILPPHNRHIHECPDYANSGLCRRKKCTLPHVDRAGQIRKHAANQVTTKPKSSATNARDAEESDISSDEEESATSNDDDFDSDGFENEPVAKDHALLEQNDYVAL
ncbi:MAG: hypothetical protein Q9190_007143 [Brigantiaea leucoxantha]